MGKFTLGVVLVVGGAFVVAGGCGAGGPVCGDGHLDRGEACDDGNDDNSDYCRNDCTARSVPSLTVKWTFNEVPELNFLGDSCIDVGAQTVAVELVRGSSSIVVEESCSSWQAVFVDIAPGNYTARVSVLDGSGGLLTESIIEHAVAFNGGIEEARVNVADDQWGRGYAGTFYFRVSWDGGDCDAADPPLASELLTLRVRGEVVQGETTDGIAVDGSEPGDCVSLDQPFPQAVVDVPFGPATLTVAGLDDEGVEVVTQEFETFVGAGPNNPELVFDVGMSTGEMDAGVGSDGGSEETTDAGVGE